MRQLTAKQVAEYFLALNNDMGDETLSNLKLQKMVYYAQGFYIAIHNKPLFQDKILAWDQGPAVQELYDEYNQNSEILTSFRPVDMNIYEQSTKELLNDVWEVYGQFAAWKLRDMVWGENPYRDTPRGEAISCEKMKAYFRDLLAETESK